MVIPSWRSLVLHDLALQKLELWAVDGTSILEAFEVSQLLHHLSACPGLLLRWLYNSRGGRAACRDWLAQRVLGPTAENQE